MRQITKRSYKNFTEEKWNKILYKKNLEIQPGKEVTTSKLDNLVQVFITNIEEALNEIAPYKTFSVKSKYRFGLSEDTKTLMATRYKLRKSISIYY